jgi:hypothetical protein
MLQDPEGTQEIDCGEPAGRAFVEIICRREAVIKIWSLQLGSAPRNNMLRNKNFSCADDAPAHFQQDCDRESSIA